MHVKLKAHGVVTLTFRFDSPPPITVYWMCCESDSKWIFGCVNSVANFAQVFSAFLTAFFSGRFLHQEIKQKRIFEVRFAPIFLGILLL